MAEQQPVANHEITVPAHKRNLRTRAAKLAAGVMAGATVIFGVSEAVAPAPAEAAAWAKSVSSPESTGDSVEGRAVVNLDDRCEGTLGCWSYIKVIAKPDRPEVPNWVEEWKYLDGHWAQDGDNQVSTPLLPGCNYYQTVVDSYNDMYGQQGSIGAGLGVKGAEVSIEKTINGVERQHARVGSDIIRFCMTA